MAVERYRHARVAPVWERENELAIWNQIWAHVARGWGRFANDTPEDAALRGALFDAILQLRHQPELMQLQITRAAQIEAENVHNIIAGSTALVEVLGKSQPKQLADFAARWVHRGMTSSDVLDSCYSLQLVSAAGFVLVELDGIIDALKARALEFQGASMMGRTHGMDAEPTTVGLWFLRHMRAFERARKRLSFGIEEAAVGKISGAVGTFSLLPVKLEAVVLEELGLTPVLASQIVPRDCYLPLFSALAGIAAQCDALATDIRLRAQSGYREVQEPFKKGQKGSSAMPHKRNPIICENQHGLFLTVVGNLSAAFHNVVSWMERDISHSSAERHIGPDMTGNVAYMLEKLTKVVSGMVVNTDTMTANITRSPWYAGLVLDKLIEKGMARTDAYALVQGAALAVLNGEYPSLEEAMAQSAEYDGILTDGEIAALADPRVGRDVLDFRFARVTD